MKTKKPKNSKARLKAAKKKAALSFYPAIDAYADLKCLSERTRVPQQEYLREGLGLILAKYKKELRS